MTGYEQKIGVLREASEKHSRMANWRVLLAIVLLGIVILVLGFLEYSQRGTGILQPAPSPAPGPACCGMQHTDTPETPHL